VVRWTETHSTKVIPVGLMGDYVPLGGSLGVFPSARYLGAMAMHLVLQWLEPSRRGDLPWLSWTTTSILAFGRMA